MNPKTKNWLGLGIWAPVASGTVSRKSLSFETHKVCTRAPLFQTSGPKVMPSILAGNIAGRHAGGGEGFHNVEEQRLRDGIRGGRGSIHVPDVGGAVEIDFEDLLNLGVAPIGTAVTVALVDQKFVVVERQHLAHAGARSEQVAVLVLQTSGLDVDDHDTEQVCGGALLVSVLDERVLHDADQRPAIRSDGQTFHAFIRGAPAGVAGNLGCADRAEVLDVKIIRQTERAQTPARRAIELIEVGTVLVGDEDAAAVVGNADALGIEPGIIRVAGVVVGIEVVGPAGEIVAMVTVDGRNARPDAQSVTGAVEEGSRAPQQRGVFRYGVRVKGRPVPEVFGSSRIWIVWKRLM